MKYVQLEGQDHLFWVGNAEQVLSEMKSFIRNLTPHKVEHQGLYTIVAITLFSTESKSYAADVIESALETIDGEYISEHNNHFFAAFRSTKQAIMYAFRVTKEMKTSGVKSVGYLYMSASRNIEDDSVLGADKVIDSLMSKVHTGQVITSRMVKRIMQGSIFTFSRFSEFEDISTKELHALYSVYTDIGIVNKANADTKAEGSNEFMNSILNAIYRNLGNESFGVEMLRKEVGLSERQLQRKIKAKINKSPNQLITSIRLQKGRELLLQQNYNVNQVAFKLGFNNPSYFSKLFKKAYGVNPKKITSM